MSATNTFKYMIPSTEKGFQEGYQTVQKNADKQEANQELLNRFNYENEARQQDEINKENRKKAELEDSYTHINTILGLDNSGDGTNTEKTPDQKPAQGQVQGQKQGQTQGQAQDNLGFNPLSLTPEKRKKAAEILSAYQASGLPLTQAMPKVLEALNPKPLKVDYGAHQTTAAYEDGSTKVLKDYGEGINPFYKPVYKDRLINTQAEIDRKTGRARYNIGSFDYNSGQWLNDKNGKPVTTNVKEVPIKGFGTNGESIYSSEFQKIMNSDYNEINKSTDSLQKIYDLGSPVLDENKNQKKDGYGNSEKTYNGFTSQQMIDQLNEEKRQGTRTILDSSTSRFQKWYNDNITANEKKFGKSLPADKFWSGIANSFVNKDIGDRDLQAAVNLMRIKYGAFDPFIKYGQINDIHSMDQMKKKLKEDSQDNSLDNE